MGKRIISYDFLRIIACLMVVMTHSQMPTTPDNALFCSFISYTCAPCIGLFFMISGALLLPIKNLTGEQFLKKRLSKIIVPMLVWTLVFIIIDCIENGTSGALLKRVFSIPFSPQGHGVMWFIYVLIGLYLLAPIVSPWLERLSEKELRMYLILWGITLCYPILGLVLEINQSNTGILYYFSGYVGYFILGYYLRHYGDKIRLSLTTIALIIAVAAPVAVKVLGWEVDFYSMFWYLSIFVVIMCVGWWKYTELLCCNLKLSDKTLSGITLVSNLTFGIYLSHIIIRDCVVKMDWLYTLYYPLQTILIAALTFSITFLLCWLISRLPKSSWVIGY